MKKIISNIGYAICVIILVWMVASFVDVNMHNLEDQQYATWNMFNVFE